MTTKNEPDRTPATVANAPAVPMLSLVSDDDEWGDVDIIDLAPATALRIPHVGVNRKLDGGIVDPSTGEIIARAGDSTYLILLGRGQTRAQWNEAYSGKAAGPPDCRSFDAVISDAQSPDRKHDACATCPFNRFGAKANPDTPHYAQCNLSEQWLVFVLDGEGLGGQYARIRWGGIAAGPAANYWGSFALRKPRLHPASVITEVTLVPTETDNGTFLAPTFRRAADVSRTNVAPLLADLPALRDAFAGAVAESVASGEDDNGTPVESGAAGAGASSDPFPEYDKPLGGQAIVDQLVGAGATVVENEPF